MNYQAFIRLKASYTDNCYRKKRRYIKEKNILKYMRCMKVIVYVVLNLRERLMNVGFEVELEIKGYDKSV